MGVFKEEAHIFEEVARNSKQIFNDAADYGYPYDSKRIPLSVQNLINTVNDLKKIDAQYPNEKNLVRNRQSGKDWVSLDVIIFWERDEGYDCGTKYSILFAKINPNHPSNMFKGSDSFISVSCERYSERT